MSKSTVKEMLSLFEVQFAACMCCRQAKKNLASFSKLICEHRCSLFPSFPRGANRKQINFEGDVEFLELQFAVCMRRRQVKEKFSIIFKIDLQTQVLHFSSASCVKELAVLCMNPMKLFYPSTDVVYFLPVPCLVNFAKFYVKLLI